MEGVGGGWLADSRQHLIFSAQSLPPRVAGARRLGTATRGDPKSGESFGAAPRIAGTLCNGAATRGAELFPLFHFKSLELDLVIICN